MSDLTGTIWKRRRDGLLVRVWSDREGEAGGLDREVAVRVGRDLAGYCRPMRTSAAALMRDCTQEASSDE